VWSTPLALAPGLRRGGRDAPHRRRAVVVTLEAPEAPRLVTQVIQAVLSRCGKRPETPFWLINQLMCILRQVFLSGG
jgi:hypothetical protein